MTSLYWKNWATWLQRIPRRGYIQPRPGNSIDAGLTGAQLRASIYGVDGELEREVVEIVADVLEAAGQRRNVITYREGLSEVLPEITESEGEQSSLQLMEERSLLAYILAE